MMNAKRLRGLDGLLALLGAVAAGVTYLGTLSVGAYPGESARYAAQRLGVLPELSPAHPLWSAVTWLTLRIRVGSEVARLNVLSALFGAIAVGLLYLVVSEAIRRIVTIEGGDAWRGVLAARLAGAAAALYLAFSVPFWVASTRAGPATADLSLLLAAAWMLQAYARTGQRWVALLFGCVYGAGIVEFPTFVILAPLFGGWLLFLLWQKNDLRTGSLLKLVGCALAGLALYLAAAWRFRGSPGYVWRGYFGLWHIVWIVWRDQFFLITRSLPQRGWLIVLIVTGAPWLAALLVARRALNEEKDWTYYLLHAVMTGLAVGVLLNFRLAPWPMLGAGRLLVTPYVLCASSYGYLVAYWFLLPSVWWSGHEEGPARWARRWLGLVCAVPCFALLAWAPWRNVQQADGRPAGLLNAFARETVEMLSGRERLITDGVLDNHLLLAAHERGRPLKTIDLTAGSSPVYMKYVASLFDAVQLQNLARLGPLPLLKEWFETEPGVERRVAVTRVPDLWRAAGFQAVPHRLLFIGAKSLSSADAARLMREHEPFWASALPRLKALTAQGGALGAAGRHLAQTAGLVANNLGVLLEDAERPGDAFAAYRKARELDPENVSALLNLNIMVEKGWATNEAEAIRGDFQELLASAESRRGSLWSLARTYGYVRAPEAYVRLGRTWALSGNPGLAVSDLKRAMAMLPDRQRDVVRQMLANVYLSQEKVEEGETLYEEMLQKDGRNVRALLGLSSLALRRGDHARAEALLGRAEEAGAPPPQVGVARALLRQAQGDPAAARAELQELVAAHPEHLPAHVALADVLLLQGDTGALGDCLVRLSRLPGSAGPVASLRASLAAQQYDWGGAARYLSEALAAMPGNVQLLERLVTVELFEGRPEQAEADARRLLALDPQNAVGHYVMAVQQIREGRHELAEDSLRRSLRRRRAVPALNDLAWLLSERGASEEAEALVREALAADPQLAQGWDTLGVILLRRGRLADAQTALERSLSLHQGDAATFLHLTEVNVARGNMSRAQELIHVLYDKVSQLSRKDQEKLNGLSRQVDEARAGRGGSEK